jgi:hypothetical protein
MILPYTKRKRNAKGQFGEESEPRTRLIRRGRWNGAPVQHRSMTRKKISQMMRITPRNGKKLVPHPLRYVSLSLAIRAGLETLQKKIQTR